MFAQKAAECALQSIDYINEHIQKILMSRQWFIMQLRSEGAVVYNSSANFILMKVPHPKDVVLQLRKNNIYVRDRSWIEQLDGTIRITIGYQKQMKKVLDAFLLMKRIHWIFPE